MFDNRISELFPENPPPGDGGSPGAAWPTQNVLPPVSLHDIFQAAAARAARDHELDKLFNPDYYGDHGSGI